MINTLQKKPEQRAKQQRAIQTKRKILKAALLEFGSAGFDGVSTRAIANRAGVNHTLIAHHFGSKEELWKVVAEQSFEIYTKQSFGRREALQGIEPVVMIRELLKDFIKFCANYPEIYRFLIQANQGDSELLNWMADNLLRSTYDEELDTIRQAQKHGVMPQGDSLHIRYLLIGAATSIFTFAPQFARLSGRDPYSDECIEQHVNYVMSIFTTCTIEP